MTTRDLRTPLRLVPDPKPEHPVLGAIEWINRLNGAVNLQREARHFEKKAREAGNTAQAQAFREVYLAAGRARENAR